MARFWSDRPPRPRPEPVKREASEASDRWMRTYPVWKVDTIVGIGGTPEEALDSAAGQVDEWLAQDDGARQLRTGDGELIAKFATNLAQDNERWVYTILATWLHYVERTEYTGKTERLA